MSTAPSHLYPPREVATDWRRRPSSHLRIPRERAAVVERLLRRRRLERLHPGDPLGRPSEALVNALGVRDLHR